MIGSIIGLIVIGLIAGFIARAVVPGKQSMTILQTLILGVVGSFAGNLIWSLLAGGRLFATSGLIGSIIGAIIVLLIYLAIKRRSGARA